MKAPRFPPRSVMPRLLLVPCLLLVPLAARAQDAGVRDAGAADSGSLYDVPDASAGSGGADRDNPEGDDTTGQPGGACRSSTECAVRFTCVQGLCQYTGIREAERVGCLLAPDDSLAMAGLGLVLLMGRRGQGRR